MNIAPGLAIAAGIGLAFIVGRDGSPTWQLVRVVVVVIVTAAVVVALRRSGVRAGALAAVAFGLVACGVGGGIALPHIEEVGFGAAAAAGLVALVAGLGLVIIATITLVRASHGWARLGVVAGVAAVAYAGLGSLGLAVAVTNVPRTGLGSATPADHGLQYAEVTFPAADGVMLSGWYVPSTNGEAVVLLHGSGSTRTSVLDHTEVFASRGYGVLVFDARGHGRSSGRAMDFGWYGDRDVAGALRFLERDAGITGRILGVGMSMGGEELVGAAASHPRLCAVVAEGATGRVAADRGWLSDAHGLRGVVQEGLDRVMFATTDALTAASPPRSLRDAVRATAPRRVLLIAARPEPDEPHAAASIADASPQTVDVWVVPGAGHTGALEARRGEWIQRVTEFFDRSAC
jgi:pimeloyl-ACP methyl ester carboxylesterase